MVSTRSKPVPAGRTRTYPDWLETSENFALIPLIDLFNHKNDGSVKLDLAKKHVWDRTVKIDEEENCMLLVSAEKTIKNNEEIFLNYGDLSDTELFTKYGFVTQQELNKHSKVTIPSGFIISEASPIVNSYAKWDPGR